MPMLKRHFLGAFSSKSFLVFRETDGIGQLSPVEERTEPSVSFLGDMKKVLEIPSDRILWISNSFDSK